MDEREEGFILGILECFTNGYTSRLQTLYLFSKMDIETSIIMELVEVENNELWEELKCLQNSTM